MSSRILILYSAQFTRLNNESISFSLIPNALVLAELTLTAELAEKAISDSKILNCLVKLFLFGSNLIKSKV